MRFMGSKRLLSKHIHPIMLGNRLDGQYWVEPFVGGANSIDKICGNRIGSDSHIHLIECLKMIRDCPESIPDVITEDDYRRLKSELRVDGLTGFCGFAMSFGGKWFGGYARHHSSHRDCPVAMRAATQSVRNSAIRQSVNLQGVDFRCCSYVDLEIPSGSLIYCDPPYAGTTRYKDSFDHDLYWDWCRDCVSAGHLLFSSEYSAPSDFVCIWDRDVSVNFSSLRNVVETKTSAVERLFVHESQSRGLIMPSV